MQKAGLHSRFLPVALVIITAVYLPPVTAKPEYANIAFHPVPLSAETGIQDKPGDSTFSGFSEVPAAESARLPASVQSDVERYVLNINNLESAGGPYQAAISEQSEALGDILLDINDSEGAVAAYEKSLYVLRINEGLYSARQISIFRKLVHAYLDQDNLQKANEMQEALLHSQKYLYTKGDDNYLGAVLEWADWNLEMALLNDIAPGRSPDEQRSAFVKNLKVAQENYIEAIELIQGSSGTTNPALVHAEKQLAAISYIASNKYRLNQAGFIPVADSYNSFTSENSRQNQVGMGHFFSGSNALKRAIAYSIESPQPDYISIAEQMMALGDWYLLFDRRTAALSVYEDAFEVLAAAEASDEVISRVMSPCMPVNAPDQPGMLTQVSENSFKGYIDVEFKVSKFGKATSPEIIGSSDEEISAIANALIRQIRTENFRPAFIDGSATSNENVKLRYYYSYN